MCKLFFTLTLSLTAFISNGKNYSYLYYLQDISDTCDLNDLNTKIRDKKISNQEAIRQIQIILPKIKKYYYKNGGKDYPKSDWVFPLQGYTNKIIGGKNGSGYIASGYDYFDGNGHGGHPAHDIFIADKNQDCLDDKTNQYVNVLSMTGGVVIAIETNWDKTSNLRGGNYVWIYDPASNSLVYYAHNTTVLVQLCSIVKPGDIIATVGRTGLNAFKKRSPTHLHLMQLRLDRNNYPKPYNCYNDLLNLKSKK